MELKDLCVVAKCNSRFENVAQKVFAGVHKNRLDSSLHSFGDDKEILEVFGPTAKYLDNKKIRIDPEPYVKLDQLTSLSLHIESRSFSHFFGYLKDGCFKQLESLELYNGIDDYIPSISINFADWLPNLKSLTLGMPDFLRPDETFLPTTLTKLYCHNVYVDGPFDTLKLLFRKNDHLIDVFAGPWVSSSIIDVLIECELHKRLKVLKIIYEYMNIEEHATELSKRLGMFVELEELTIEYDPGSKVTGLAAALVKMPKLKKLFLTNVEGETEAEENAFLTSLASNMPRHLKKLSCKASFPLANDAAWSALKTAVPTCSIIHNE